MRRSELAGAEREFVDLENAVLEIGDTRVVADGRAGESDGKTPSGRRVISLDPLTVVWLRHHLAMLKEEREAFEERYQDAGKLVCRPDGRPVHPDTITTRLTGSSTGPGYAGYACTTCATPTPRWPWTRA
jgi:integrase